MYGTARSQMNVRLVLSPLNVRWVPKTVLVPHAGKAFDAGGGLADPEIAAALRAWGASSWRHSAPAWAGL
jgi:hypothetical protein